MGMRRTVSLEDRFVATFSSAALQAGAVARRLQGQVEHRTKLGSSAEAEAVSVADLAAQDVLLLRLSEVLGECAVDAEEETESVACFPPADGDRPLLVIDPIDGSLSYLRGSDDYAVMGALLRGGSFRAAVIHFPPRGDLYWAVAGRGCYRRDADGRTQRVVLGSSPARVLVPPRVPAEVRRRVEALGYEVQQSRCSAIDASAPVVGRAIASVNHEAPDRRRAIGFLLVREAGGVVVTESGVWSGEDPDAGHRIGAHAIAASEVLARRLLGATRDAASPIAPR